MLNDRLANIVESTKNQINEVLLIKDSKKSADYAIRIANAREFLKMELDNLQDDSFIVDDSEQIKGWNGIIDESNAKNLDSEMFLILKDFVEDFETMKLFKKMVQKKVKNYYNSNGECIFPVTFGKVSEYESIFNAIDELEDLSQNIFNHEKVKGEMLISIRGHHYFLPDDGYTEKEEEINLEHISLILDDIMDNINTSEEYVNDGSGQVIEMKKKD